MRAGNRWRCALERRVETCQKETGVTLKMQGVEVVKVNEWDGLVLCRGGKEDHSGCSEGGHAEQSTGARMRGDQVILCCDPRKIYEVLICVKYTNNLQKCMSKI